MAGAERYDPHRRTVFNEATEFLNDSSLSLCVFMGIVLGPMSGRDAFMKPGISQNGRGDDGGHISARPRNCDSIRAQID